MRTDVTIDKRQVLCRKASLIGYGERYARRGALIMYEDSDGAMRIARVLGAISGSSADGWINRHILAMVLAETGTHAYERWVDPEHVRNVLNPGNLDVQSFAAFFFGALPDTNIVRRLMDYGTVSALHIHNAPKHIAELSK